MYAISVVVPVYNSAEILALLAERLDRVATANDWRLELILVNDCSRDHSWSVISDLADRYTWVRGINLMRNYGQHNALLCGIREANHDVIVTMDDDLQHPPEEIPRLLEELGRGFDVVYGTPQREQHGFWRDTASQTTKLVLQSAMGAEIARSVTSFRVFRASLRESFASYTGSYVFIDALLTWGTTRFSALPVRHDPREIGASNYNLRKLVLHALNMTTGFSVLPLQISSLIGFAFTILGFILLVYVAIRSLTQSPTLWGFYILAGMITIFAGAQLFALGIIGEYLARMHFRMMERPAYTIRQQVHSSAKVDLISERIRK
ncbi:MAG TPA: glycosyltransferase family 2 protein [Blastocatellia bacterium]|nr:glycosyltransferase family 2 protein [Blastocatellia bacterium]